MFRACWTFCRGGGSPVTGPGRPHGRAYPWRNPGSRTGWRRQGTRDGGYGMEGILTQGREAESGGREGRFGCNRDRRSRSAGPCSPQPQNGRSSAAASADAISGSDTAAPLPLGLSRNCTRPPGASRISVENRSASSSSFFHRRVCSLPAT